MTHRRLLLWGCVPLFAPAAAPVAVVVPDGIGGTTGLDFGTRLSPLTFLPPGEPRSDCAVARATVSPTATPLARIIQGPAGVGVVSIVFAGG